jgi:hypothetical protein
MEFRNHGAFALAIVIVGHVVAAADRPNNRRTNLWNPGAGAGLVKPAADADFILAKLAGLTRLTDEAAAALGHASRLGAVGSEQCQRYRREKNNKLGFHGCLREMFSF